MIYKLLKIYSTAPPQPHQQKSPHLILSVLNKNFRVIHPMQTSFLAVTVAIAVVSLYLFFNTRLFVHIILNIIDLQYLQNVVFSIEKGSNGQNHTLFRFPMSDQKKNSRIKISHFSLELIFSAKICISKTWYNWSSDINIFFFHFSGMSVNFLPFLSWLIVWGYVSYTRFITFTEEFQVHLECEIDLGIKP